MLWRVAVVLLVLWVLGLSTSVGLSGVVHVLIAAAVVLGFLRLVQGMLPPLHT